jgi:hypothetical protein
MGFAGVMVSIDDLLGNNRIVLKNDGFRVALVGDESFGWTKFAANLP